MEDYERILLIKQDVFIYKIPPRTTNRAYRAADWKLDEPDWNGRMRLVTKGKDLIMKLEDKMSGELFAKCPIDAYPGIAIEAVSDSSRYFVIRLQDDNGRNAFIGLGFSDRGDSFDLNVSLQDHFKLVQKEEEIDKEPEKELPKLDLGFKEGQTIKVNLNIKKSGNSSNRPKAKLPSSGTGILPPPPGAIKLPPPSSTTVKHSQNISSAKSSSQSETISQSNDLLDLDIGSLNINTTSSSDKFNNESNLKTENWSEFTSADKQGGETVAEKKNDSWAQF